MSKWKKKPVVVNAFKWTGGHDQEEDPAWVVEAIKNDVIRFAEKGDKDVVMKIKTLEGVMTARQGDYIIRGIQGEIYPCKPDIFESTYEKVM